MQATTKSQTSLPGQMMMTLCTKNSSTTLLLTFQSQEILICKIINLKDSQPSDSFHAANVNFVNKTVNDSNSMITTNYTNYVNTAKAELTKSLTDSFTKIGKSHISAAVGKKNMYSVTSWQTLMNHRVRQHNSQRYHRLF